MKIVSNLLITCGLSVDKILAPKRVFVINDTQRYQKGLTMAYLFPSKEGYCACGCGKELPRGRRKWYSDECQYDAYIQFAIVKGDTSIIRNELFRRDGGFCRSCGLLAIEWHADHVIPVQNGGAACGLDNFQTLCVECHQEKTSHQMVSHHKTISSQAAEILDMVRL